jgi:hypothetical protein
VAKVDLKKVFGKRTVSRELAAAHIFERKQKMKVSPDNSEVPFVFFYFEELKLFF